MTLDLLLRGYFRKNEFIKVVSFPFLSFSEETMQVITFKIIHSSISFYFFSFPFPQSKQ